jgi:hypothetical protein
MQKINTTEELKAAIALLSIKQAKEGVLLREQLQLTYENLRPANLIRNTLSELTSSGLKGGIVNNLMGLAAGFVSKKIAVGDSNNIIKLLLGGFLQTGVTKVVSENGDGIRSGLANLISNFMKKNKE